jgi:hypothetical protein
MGQMESFGGTSAPVTYGGAPTNQKTDIFGRPIV